MRSRNTRRVIALVIVVGVIVAGAFAVTSQRSPEARVRAAVEALANRQTTPVIADAAGFARSTGLAFMPAGIGMTVSDWQATTTEQTVQAQWTVVATGNGARVAAAMLATFEEIGEVYAWTEAEGYLRATGLVAGQRILRPSSSLCARRIWPTARLARTRRSSRYWPTTRTHHCRRP